MTKKIVTLAGDGIGPEIMAAGLEVLAAVARKLILIIQLRRIPLVVLLLTKLVIHSQKKL
jgi:3-isopropylmalate dehydrogenase (EC 1.1.1.85)